MNTTEGLISGGNFHIVLIVLDIFIPGYLAKYALMRGKLIAYFLRVL